MDGNYKYVTLLSTDDYILGTLCLAQSLRRVKSKYKLLVLCSQNISERVISVLNQEKLDYSILKDSLNIDANTNPDYKRWNYTFDKLAVFNLTQYSKIISLDSDMYVVKNIDHLFSHPHLSAAIADKLDQPDCKELNSGLMVICPSSAEYEGLLTTAETFVKEKKDYYGDQDIIRYYYSEWSHNAELELPLTYNMFYPWCNEIERRFAGRGYNVHFVHKKKPFEFSFTAFLRRLLKFNKEYLIKYMLMVWYFKIKYSL